MNKERLEKFIKETLNAPYFSTLYDRDMWEQDKQELIRDLEILEILKGKILLISDLESTNDFEKIKGWLYDK